MDLQDASVSSDKHNSAFKFISWVLKSNFSDVFLLSFSVQEYFVGKTDGTVTTNVEIMES